MDVKIEEEPKRKVGRPPLGDRAKVTHTLRIDAGLDEAIRREVAEKGGSIISVIEDALRKRFGSN